MGLVERFSKLRSRWSRSFPPNLARLMLLGCAALWGGSYLLAKFAMEAIPPQWLMGLRMIGACLCMLALFHKHIVPYLTPKIIVPAARGGSDLLGARWSPRPSACRPLNRAAARS